MLLTTSGSQPDQTEMPFPLFITWHPKDWKEQQERLQKAANFFATQAVTVPLELCDVWFQCCERIKVEITINTLSEGSIMAVTTTSIDNHSFFLNKGHHAKSEHD